MNKIMFRWIAPCLGLVLSLLPGITPAQNANLQTADFIVAVVNTEPITRQEWLRAQQQGGRDGQPLAPQQALDLLIEQRVLLQRAEELGIKADPALVDQMIQNIANNNRMSREALLAQLAKEGVNEGAWRRDLTTQYIVQQLREREVNSQVRVNDAEIDRYMRDDLGLKPQPAPADLQLGMILLPLPDNPTPAQVSEQTQRALALIQRARSGANFFALAAEAGMRGNGDLQPGDMGLRSPERYPELFVQASASLQVGQVSEPVRSGAGIHVLKLIERQGGRVLVPQSQVRHILIRPDERLNQNQVIEELGRLRSAIVNGQVDFARAAQQYSQDGSAPQGGDLGWSTPGQMVPEFEELLQKTAVGEISQPLVSRFGVHLLQVQGRREVAVPLKDLRETARQLLRDKKAQVQYERWLADLKARAYIELRETGS
jgi:peptidyl-prolyl cis-trans isomerase SurA